MVQLKSRYYNETDPWDYPQKAVSSEVYWWLISTYHQYLPCAVHADSISFSSNLFPDLLKILPPPPPQDKSIFLTTSEDTTVRVQDMSTILHTFIVDSLQ